MGDYRLNEEELEAQVESTSDSDDEEFDNDEIVEVLKGLHAEALDRGHLRKAKVLSLVLSEYATEDDEGSEDEDEEYDEEDSSDEDEESSDDEEEDEETSRTMTLTQREWDAVLDWSKSAVKGDGDIAEIKLMSDLRRALSGFLEVIEGEWQEAAPDQDEEMEFDLSSEAWGLLDKLFYDLSKGAHIARSVSASLRGRIREGAGKVYSAI